MATIRTLLGLGALLLLAALGSGWGGPFTLAEEPLLPETEVPVSSGFGAPERVERTPARDLPDRLAAAAGTDARPAALERPAAAAPHAGGAAFAARATPLYLSHCAFLC